MISYDTFILLTIFSKLELFLVIIIIILILYYLKNIRVMLGMFIFNNFSDCAVHTINSNLTNGVVNIHPAIYLFCVCTLFFILIKQFLNLRYTLSLQFLLVLSASLIILGSYWASQELSWGG
jgi:hypothetical protein